MNRNLLDRFIAKYSLGGIIETVEWESDGTTISTTASHEQKTVVVKVTMPVPFPQGKFAIYTTSQLRSLIDVLGDEIDIAIQLRNKVPGAFLFSDKKTKVTTSLADPKINVFHPVVKALPIPEIDGFIEQEFASSFIRAKGALGTEEFEVHCDGSKCEFIQRDTGGNMVALELQTITKNAISAPVTFESKYLQAILSANKDLNHGRVAVYGAGLIHVHYDEPNGSIDYYLSKTIKY